MHSLSNSESSAARPIQAQSPHLSPGSIHPTRRGRSCWWQELLRDDGLGGSKQVLLGTTATCVIVVSCCLSLCLHHFVELLCGPQILLCVHPCAQPDNHSTVVLVNGTVQIGRGCCWWGGDCRRPAPPALHLGVRTIEGIVLDHQLPVPPLLARRCT